MRFQFESLHNQNLILNKLFDKKVIQDLKDSHNLINKENIE